MKWYGIIGFSDTIETEPGIWEESVIERHYYGDVISNYWKRQDSNNVVDNINISNNISIISDPYISNRCSKIIYVEYMGTKWKVTNIEVSFPRLILTIGGLYNE